jgi:alcohol dehydrogenase
MKSFEFYNPTKIIFGTGAESCVGNEILQLGGRQVLVIHTTNQSLATLIDGILCQLEQAGIKYNCLTGVVPNPKLSLVAKGIETGRAMKADFVLAIGGGSVIDTAKAIAVGIANPGGDIWDFFSGQRDPEVSLPVGVILTLAAAGSESSMSSVITHDESKLKRSMDLDLLRPKFALMNPELLKTLPAVQIGHSIVDVMMHTLERYFSIDQGNKLTDCIAEGLLRNVIDCGRILSKDRQNLQALSELMWSGSISHNGLTGLGADGDWSTHIMSQELSGLFDVPHGAALAALWGSWARYVMANDLPRFAQYAANVWGVKFDCRDLTSAASLGIQLTEELFASLGMPISIPELGIGTLDDGMLNLMSQRATNGGQNSFGSIKLLNDTDVYEIYKRANC